MNEPYPGPHDAQEGETYSLEVGEETVDATVTRLEVHDDGSASVVLSFNGGQ